jgi:di/tricarboxylate transporter
VGVRVGDARFRRLYGVTVMALQRRGAHFREKVTQMDLRPGDILLIYGDETALENLKAADEFIVLERPRLVHSESRSALWALLIMGGMVALVALGLASLLTAAMAGALVMVLSGCLRAQDAYAAIDFRLLVLIAGALALGAAIEETGTATLMANQVASLTGRFGPTAVLAVIYLLPMLTTEMLSNNAAAVIIFPIAVSAADSLGVDPRPFVMAVTFAASASFSTPIGYQTNTLVYGAGGYRFIDFARVGVPLNLLFWGLAVVGIPLVWEF